MMKTLDITSETRAKLALLDVPQNVLDRITATTDCEADGSGQFRSTITMGYPETKKGFERLKACASINCSNERFDDLLATRARVATFIHLGMNASPAATRFELPAWVVELSDAPERRADMASARKAARAAIARAA